MNVYELYNVVNSVAPFSLSEDLKKIGYHDNSGIICEGQGDKILCVLDLTIGAVEFAKQNGCGLILTHHPAIYAPIYNVKGAIAECVKNSIGVVSAHLNADVALNGVDYYLANLLGAKNEKILQHGNYGRLFEIKEQTLLEYSNFVKEKLNCKNVCVFGNENVIVKKVASFCGAGIDEQTLALCQDADVIVSSDIKHHLLLSATQSGKCVIMPTHFATENLPFKLFCTDLSKKIKESVLYFEQDTLL